MRCWFRTRRLLSFFVKLCLILFSISGVLHVLTEPIENTCHLIDAMHRTLDKIWERGDIDVDTLQYFDVENPEFSRFYLLPKVHKGCVVF